MCGVLRNSLCVVLWVLDMVVSRCPSNIVEYGDTVFDLSHKYTFKGQRRMYRVHIPSSYRHDRPNPVVLLLHGSGGNAERIAQGSGFQTLSDQEGFVLALGEGVTDGWPDVKKEKRSWNAGLCCSTSWINGVDDVAYIEALLDHLQERFCVDTQNVFTAGHANGGMMAYRLACQLSNRISAVAVNAAGLLHQDYQSCMIPCQQHEQPPCRQRYSQLRCPFRSLPSLPSVYQCLMKRPVSVLHMHGLLDTRVPYNGGIGLKHLGNATFAPVKTLIRHILAPYLKCSSERRLTFLNRTDPNDAAVCEEYMGCNEARLQLCKLKNGGHHIPGGTLPKYCDKSGSSYKRKFCSSWKKLLGPPTNSIRFAETSWQFFRSLSKRAKGLKKGPRSAMSVRDRANNLICTWMVYPLLSTVTLVVVYFH